MTVSNLLQVATAQASATGAITLAFQPVSQGGVWQGSVSVPASTGEVWSISVGSQVVATVTGSSPYGPVTVSGGQSLSLSAQTRASSFLSAVMTGIQGYGPDDVAAIPPSTPNGSPTLAPVFGLLGSFVASGPPITIIPSPAAVQLVIVGPASAAFLGPATVIGAASNTPLPVAGAGTMTIAALPGTPADQAAGYVVSVPPDVNRPTIYVYQATLPIIDLSLAPVSAPTAFFASPEPMFVPWGTTAVILETAPGAGGSGPTVTDVNGNSLPVTEVSAGIYWFPVSSPAFGPFTITWAVPPTGLGWYAVPVDVNPFETGSAAGGGALTLIASQVLAAPAATVTFSAIPATYNHLRLVVVGRSATAAEFDDPAVTFNADGGANYDQNACYQIGANTAGAFSNPAQTSINWGQGIFPGAGSTAGVPGVLEMEVPAYALTTFDKVASMVAGLNDGQKAMGDVLVGTLLGKWRNTAAINEVQVALTSGANWVTGSAFYLYGIT